MPRWSAEQSAVFAAELRWASVSHGQAYGGDILRTAAQARSAEARGEGVGTFPLFPTEEQARAIGGHLLEGWEYYCSPRASHPRSARFFTWNSVDRIVYFDAFRFVDLIAPRPLLMVVGTEAITSWMTEEALRNANGPKELFRIDGASHVDLYDKNEYVDPAMSKLGDFFRDTLR